MKRFLQRTILLIMALGLPAGVSAFSLLGPLKAYQVGALSYDLAGDIGGPLNPSEGYRWNVPVVTYAFDASFINYFGSNGITAVEQAIAVLNALPPFSQITNDASQLYIRGEPVPFETLRVNFQAQRLGLRDVKSTALHFLVEEMGLAEPERWVWALRGRNTETIAGQTFTNYNVINLNFDPITRQPTPFVNSAKYNYIIDDPIPPSNRADAEETSDPLAFTFSSVAGGFLFAGTFYPGLTHDDVGGLRWLYSTNNLAVDQTLPTVSGRIQGARLSPWSPVVLGATNQTGTNIVTGTNVAGSNLTFVVQALRGGVDRVRFQRVNFDSLLGNTFFPVTNAYTDVFITNSRPVRQNLQRVITTPDILFVVEDLGIDADLFPFLSARTDTTGWINNDPINGVGNQGGPGVIPPGVIIRFTDQLPFFLNTSPGVITGPPDPDDPTGIGIISSFIGNLWGSFDATTNAPIIYPAYGNLTVQDLEQLVLSQGTTP